MFWKKWKRDPNRGRAGRTEQANLERRTMGQLDADQDLRSTGRMGSGIEGLEYKELLSLNRFSILFKTHDPFNRHFVEIFKTIPIYP